MGVGGCGVGCLIDCLFGNTSTICVPRAIHVAE